MVELPLYRIGQENRGGLHNFSVPLREKERQQKNANQISIKEGTLIENL